MEAFFGVSAPGRQSAMRPPAAPVHSVDSLNPQNSTSPQPKPGENLYETLNPERQPPIQTRRSPKHEPKPLN